tara:strand:- start:70 stop:471 length:402 start_codon:yes stop_codon:yes gene_type:complete
MTSHKDAISNLLSSFNGVTTLFLEDIVRDVDLGVYDFEIGNPQKVKFDIYVMLSEVRNPENDKLEEVLNYEYLIESLDHVLSSARFSLLETLAHRLLEEVSIPNSVKAASVVITKLDILNGDGTLGCSMTKIK